MPGPAAARETSADLCKRDRAEVPEVDPDVDLAGQRREAAVAVPVQVDRCAISWMRAAAPWRCAFRIGRVADSTSLGAPEPLDQQPTVDKMPFEFIAERADWCDGGTSK